MYDVLSIFSCDLYEWSLSHCIVANSNYLQYYRYDKTRGSFSMEIEVSKDMYQPTNYVHF